jgi:hypothetical protein
MVLQRPIESTQFSRNFDSDFLVAVDFRVDRAAKEERHTPALVFVKMEHSSSPFSPGNIQNGSSRALVPNRVCSFEDSGGGLVRSLRRRNAVDRHGAD